MKYKNLFYIGSFNKIGGVESWIYYISRLYSEDYDITVMYLRGDTEQINRLKKYVRCIRYIGQDVECENLYLCYSQEILKTVKADKIIQFLHADFEEMKRITKKDFICSDMIDELYSVSEVARKGYLNLHNKDSKVIYNPIYVENPKKVLKLISACRLRKEKGSRRMNIMAKALNELGIPFIWLVFTDTPVANSDINGLIYMKPKFNITDYIKESDFYVSLSDTESWGYSTEESLILGIPVIATRYKVLDEIGIKDKVNGYILDFEDFNNYDIMKKKLQEIYESEKLIFSYNPPQNRFSEIMIKSKSNYKEELKMKVKVEAITTFTYSNYDNIELLDKEKNNNKIVKNGDKFICTYEQYDYLSNFNYNDKIKPLVKLIEKIEEPVEIIPKDIKPNKKTTKKAKKEDK